MYALVTTALKVLTENSNAAFLSIAPLIAT